MINTLHFIRSPKPSPQHPTWICSQLYHPQILAPLCCFCLKHTQAAYQLSNFMLELSSLMCSLKFQSPPHQFCIAVFSEEVKLHHVCCGNADGFGVKQWVEVEVGEWGERGADWPAGNININTGGKSLWASPPVLRSREWLILRPLLKPSLIRREISLAMDSQIKSPYLQW